ncbi:MAG: hypothetical protein IJF92_02745 [Bacilli bacterium]|nr:hypothetical protein [Bacilli bacterium]
MSDFTKEELTQIYYNTMPGVDGSKDKCGYGADNPWLKKLWNDTINKYLENYDETKEADTISEEITSEFENKIVSVLNEITETEEYKIADAPKWAEYGEQKALEKMVQYIETNTDKKSEVRDAMRNVCEKREEGTEVFKEPPLPVVYSEEIEDVVLDYVDNYLYDNAIELGIDGLENDDSDIMQAKEEGKLKPNEKYTKLFNALNHNFSFENEKDNPEFGYSEMLVPTKEVTDKIVNKNIEKFIKENNINSPEEYFIRENNKLLKKLSEATDYDENEIENLFESDEVKPKDIISGRKF